MVKSEFKPIRVRHEGIIRLSASGRSLRIDIQNQKYYADLTRVKQVINGERKSTTIYRYIQESK